MTSSQPLPGFKPSLWLCFLVPVVLGVLAITGRSFWIDECVTAQYISQPTVSEWAQDLLTTDFAEAQMPFYLAYLWAWEKVFGCGEWSLRYAAVPWFVAGVTMLFVSLRRFGALVWFAMLTISSSTFTWYYLNEARLYTMQFGVACAVAGSLLLLIHELSERKCSARVCFQLFLASIVLLSSISIIGMLWAGAAILSAPVVLGLKSLWRLVRSTPWYTMIGVMLLIALACYYVWTVFRGARASSLATTNIQTIIYVAYEILGFSGLGPGRDALRLDGARALLPYGLGLGLFALITFVVVAAGLWSLWKSSFRMKLMGVLAALSVPIVFLIVTGVMRHFRLLGRHCTPVLVVVLLVLSVGLVRLWSCGRKGRLVVVVYLALSVVSATQIRFASRHLKDDYRSAADLAHTALDSGSKVWWAAAPQGALYYDLPITENNEGSEIAAYSVFGQTHDQLRSGPAPDLVLLSRPDIYDHQGGLAGYLGERGYQRIRNLPGFELWERPAPDRTRE